MTQTVIVYIIGALLIIFIAWRIYRMIKNKDKRSICANCPASRECNCEKTADSPKGCDKQ